MADVIVINENKSDVDSEEDPAAEDVEDVLMSKTALRRIQKEKEDEIVFQHAEDLDKIRHFSAHSINGKRTTGSLSLYHHMQNVVASNLQARKKSGGQSNDPIEEKIKYLQDSNWPEDEITEEIQQALTTIQIRKQATIRDFFKKKPEPKSLAAKTNTSEGKKPTLISEEARSKNQEKVSKLKSLALTLKITNTGLLNQWPATDPINIASATLETKLKSFSAYEREEANTVKFRKNASKAKNNKEAFERSKYKLKKTIGELSEKLKERDEMAGDNDLDVETMQAKMTIVKAIDVKKKEALSLITEVEQNMKKVKRYLDQRKSNKNLDMTKNDTPVLETFSTDRTWWSSLEKIQKKFREAVDKTVNEENHKHANRDMTISGFNEEFYVRTSNIFNYHRSIGSEFVPVELIMSENKVPKARKAAMLNALKVNLPVSQFMYKGSSYVLDNEHIDSNPDIIVKIMSLEEVITDQFLSNSSRKEAKKRHKRKRTAFHEKYPTVLEKAKIIIEQGNSETHPGVEADSRRRTDLGFCSITIPLLRKRLSEVLNSHEKMPSLRTLRYWMTAPKKNSRTSRKYHNLIPARVPIKKNTRVMGGVNHEDAHSAAAYVRHLREFGEKHKDHVNVWSCDDKVRKISFKFYYSFFFTIFFRLRFVLVFQCSTGFLPCQFTPKDQIQILETMMSDQVNI